MEWIIILVALMASFLTLFSGFGLGTLLLPAFALVWPTPLALAATAVVHLTNNIFKGTLLWKDANLKVVIRFGIPALIAAVFGALLLVKLPNEVVFTHQYGSATILDLVVGLLIVLFALIDVMPGTKNWHMPGKFLPIGGVLSGFFGGLSGHQGALRSAFLANAGLTAKGFVATATLCAVLVDVSRLLVYGKGLPTRELVADGGGFIVLYACLAAFLGAYIGKRLLGKVTMQSVRMIVGIGLLLVGSGMAAGLL